MLHNKLTHIAPIDEEASHYLTRIKQIDRIVEGPVRTLIGLTQGRKKTGEGETAGEDPIYFPTWISPELRPQNEDNRLTQAICCSTLQRVRRFRRRFPWLGKTAEKQLRDVRDELVSVFTPAHPDSFEECAELLNSETFGGLNPLTASRIFRVLLEHGEGSAHSGIGFLAFFAMIWPLSRTFPNRLTAGARIEPWDATAYVTAKCLLPIRKLQGIIEQRATLYDEIRGNLKALKDNSAGKNPRDHWSFKIALDDLSANLSHVSRLAIDKNAFADCAASVLQFSRSDDSDSEVYAKVLKSFRKALEAIKSTSEQVLTHTEKIVGSIEYRIAKALRAKHQELNKPTPNKPLVDALYHSLTKPPLNLRFAPEYSHNKDYWEDLAAAAEKSIVYCRTALTELEVACNICPPAKPAAENVSTDLYGVITSALAELAKANRKVKDVLNQPVHDAALRQFTTAG